MFIPTELKRDNSKILKHDMDNANLGADYIRRKLKLLHTNDKAIERIIRNYKLMANNYCGAAASFVAENVGNRRFKAEFFGYLYKYIKQFYFKDEEYKKVKNPLDLFKLFREYFFEFNGYIDGYIKRLGLGIKCNWKKLNKIFDFYSIIEDFLIRFYGYSVIGIGGCKYIITSQSDCYKKFEDQLMHGYKLIRLQRVYMKESNRYFGFIPALPIGDIDVPVNEFIEPSGKRNIIKTRKLLPVVKPRECNE